VVVASWIPVLVGAATRATAGWAAVVVLAVAIELLTRRLSGTVLATGFVISSAFVASGLVTDATHYMPVAATGGALALRIGMEARQRGRLDSPAPRAVLLAVAVYMAWAALATLTSINRHVSLEYLVGMAAVCALAFYAIPGVVREPSDRERLLASIGVLGVVVAASVYAVEITGNATIFGRAVGSYLRTDLTISGHALGILFGRSSGAYLSPFEPGLTMAMAAGALLGWSATRGGRRLFLSRVALVFLMPAILLTMDRSAWLAAVVMAGMLAALAITRGFRVSDAAAVCGFFAAVFLLVLVGALGTNAVGNFCSKNCGPGIVEVLMRGGTGLTGREYLWPASLHAIAHRPIAGYGPGNDVPAIAPYLGTSGQGIEVLTSHSTWLRTAVEMGVPGLVFLLWVLLAVAWVFLRGVLRRSTVQDPARLALAALLCGLVPAMTFESFLLGGVTFTSLFLAIALGLVAVPPADPAERIP
jgi:O-antigen ligase